MTGVQTCALPICDGSKNGQNHINGKMPAGYISVWDFGSGEQTKYAPTSGGGKKVY